MSQSTRKWQAEAHRLFRLYIRNEFQALVENLEELLHQLRYDGRIDEKQLILFREHLGMFERTLTEELVDLGQVEAKSDVERLERQGQQLQQEFHNLAYRYHNDAELDQAVRSARDTLRDARQLLKQTST